MKDFTSLLTQRDALTYSTVWVSLIFLPVSKLDFGTKVKRNLKNAHKEGNNHILHSLCNVTTHIYMNTTCSHQQEFMRLGPGRTLHAADTLILLIKFQFRSHQSSEINVFPPPPHFPVLCLWLWTDI